METVRPLATVAAVILLEVIAIGSFGFGVLLLIAGAQFQLGTAGAFLGLTAVAAIVAAVCAVAAGFGLWRGRAWGWALAMGVAVVGLLAVAIAALSGGFQTQLLLAVVLFVGLIGCLLMPSARARSGIG